jgi:hypothetical protein
LIQAYSSATDLFCSVVILSGISCLVCEVHRSLQTVCVHKQGSSSPQSFIFIIILYVIIQFYHIKSVV